MCRSFKLFALFLNSTQRHLKISRLQEQSETKRTDVNAVYFGAYTVNRIQAYFDTNNRIHRICMIKFQYLIFEL